MREPYAHGFDEHDGIWEMSDRVSFAERFLNATKREDYERLNDEHHRLFGESCVGQAPEDVAAVCELMRQADMLYSLAIPSTPKDAPAYEDLARCGIFPFYWGVAPADTPSDEMPMEHMGWHYHSMATGDNYRFWLERAAGKVEGRFPGYELAMTFRSLGDGRGLLNDTMRFTSVGRQKTYSEVCGFFLRRLVGLHLADVATVCHPDTLEPVQVPYSGISALWLGLSERMRGGRTFRCKACGKPSIDYGGRRKREYCSTACRKWASYHPNETRGHWYNGR